MKKILFCLQTMVFGGVEKELITILKQFDRTKYNLTVLLMYEQDINVQKRIPDDVQVINLDIKKDYFCSGTSKLISERLKHHKFREIVKLIIGQAVRKNPAPAIISIDELPTQNEQYDYAVCYHVHSPIVLRYVADKVTANKKIAWIHNDFTTTGYKIEKYDSWLRKYDSFIGVSTQLTSEFVVRCPQYINKSKTVHNIVDQEEIISKAADLTEVETSFIEDQRFKIVTVGRFVEQKGFDIAIEVCEYLKNKNVSVAWYAVGYGKDEDKLIQLIREKNLEKEFIILGRKENPYPYINMADLYVQPSRHEGYAISIEEAKALKKVIVCTNFSGASEQIKDKKNGIVVKQFSAKVIGDVLFNLYNNQELLQELHFNIQKEERLSGWKKIEEVF